MSPHPEMWVLGLAFVAPRGETRRAPGSRSKQGTCCPPSVWPQGNNKPHREGSTENHFKVPWLWWEPRAGPPHCCEAVGGGRMRDRRAAFVSNQLDRNSALGIQPQRASRAVRVRPGRPLPVGTGGVSLRPWGAWGEWQGPMASGLVPSWHWLGLQLPVCKAPGAEKLPPPPVCLWTL